MPIKQFYLCVEGGGGFQRLRGKGSLRPKQNSFPGFGRLRIPFSQNFRFYTFSHVISAFRYFKFRLPVCHYLNCGRRGKTVGRRIRKKKLRPIRIQISYVSRSNKQHEDIKVPKQYIIKMKCPGTD